MEKFEIFLAALPRRLTIIYNHLTVMKFDTLPIGIFLVAMTTLMLELTLIRVFDVIGYPNMAYMIITLAMLCFGSAGVYYSIRPFSGKTDIHLHLANLSHLFALAIFAIYPVLNNIPFTFNLFASDPFQATVYFLIIYFFLAAPFFLAGLIFSTIFSLYSKEIQRLYFWDLAGAAIGCFILIPFLPSIGTSGLVFLAAVLALLASGFFSKNKTWLTVSFVFGIFILYFPVSLYPEHYFEFKQYANKRSLKHFKQAKMVEKTHWDPISKIDVVNVGNKKFIAYDGGSQTSYIYPFDGDYVKLRNSLPEKAHTHFWGRMVLASHFLKRDTEQSVLVIGAAGGQETKAALVYGASSVDAVELVGYVIEIGKEDYAEYNGGIYLDPRVNAFKGEGRSFLNSNNNKYDIIQMFSNHTSSSIASGTGSMSANYLQTVEAYKDYFSKLKMDGVLHINHHIYPRIVTTAAKAWKELGHSSFSEHILVFEKPLVVDNLPTVLIKMSPWTEEQVRDLKDFLGEASKLVVNPMDASSSYLPRQFFSGNLPDSFVERVDYAIAPATDDKPFFNFLRKKVEKVEVNDANYMNSSIAGFLNSQLTGKVPMDIIHLVVTSITSILFALIFIGIAWFNAQGRANWRMGIQTTIYFACLGAGFIIIELVFIQLFMRLIGYPLYTYSTVVFTILVSAALGSLSSEKLNIRMDNKWQYPYIGVIVVGVLLLFIQPFITDIFLTADTILRVFVAIILIFPLGFFLGMPFPLGILTIKKEEIGAVGWAWGINGLFTVIGGILSVVLSIVFGFKLTIFIALAIYCLAFLMISQLRQKALAA